jgi:peptidoglycan/xylan/chitin deacetylase (PgdA/CDA1 family)
MSQNVPSARDRLNEPAQLRRTTRFLKVASPRSPEPVTGNYRWLPVGANHLNEPAQLRSTPLHLKMPPMPRALAFVMLLLCCLGGSAPVSTTRPVLPDLAQKPWTIVEGGVTRGDTSRKQLALIFTGGDFGEGTGHVLDTLAAHDIKASFFFTGDYLRKPEHAQFLKRILADNHYLGPHSDKHPLYAPWEDRKKTLITRDDFRADLQKNIDDLRKLGALKDPSQLVYFIPPYEWYNEDQSRWSAEMGVFLFNFTPGSGSNRDWAPENHKSFALSKRIIEDVLAYEQKDPHGLSGFLLLLHVGSQRKDKTFLLLDDLLKELEARGYQFARVDELLPLTSDK